MSAIDKNDLNYVTKRYGAPIASTPCPIGEKGKINPHVSRFNYKDDRYVSVYHVKPVYYETPKGEWRPLYEVCQYYGNRNIIFNYESLLKVHPRYIEWLTKRTALLGGKVLVTNPFNETPSEYGYITNLVHNTITRPNIGLTTTTVYPDPDPESTTVDGFATSGYKSTMQLMHDTTTGDGGQATSPFGNNAYIIRTLRNASGYYGGRCFWLFDTASIPDGDTINSATLSLYGHTYAYDNDNSTTFEIVASNPASNTNITASDFGNLSYTSFASLAFGSMSQSAYNDFTLNSSGRANISKTGVSKFGALTGQDLNVSAQTSGQDNIFATKEAESTGTTTDPKLVVDHSGGTAYIKSLTEATTVAGTIRRGVTKIRSEAATITETVRKGSLKGILDTVTITGAFSSLNVKLQEIIESITVNDTLGRAITKTLTEVATITETVRKAIARVFTEATTITIAIAAVTATYTKLLVDTITTSDTLSRISGYGRQLVENIQVTEYFRMALNGINAFWQDIYTDTADEWADIYHDN